jgi:hypothetical protein
MFTILTSDDKLLKLPRHIYDQTFQAEELLKELPLKLKCVVRNSDDTITDITKQDDGEA